MIGLVLRVLGWARAALQAAFALVLRYPMQAALIASVALAGWQTWQLATCKQSLQVARAEHAATVARYTEAQRNAAIKARAAREATEARYATHAKETDLAHETELERALAAARRYAATNRVRAEAVGSASIGATASATGDSAGSADGPGQEAVVVTGSDVEICTINTVRLESVRAWALGLNAPSGGAQSIP